jgi:aminopeptidase N
VATNTTKTIATTQFESTDSRRAFPSLDEPSLKAVFSVSLGRRRDMISLSNMKLSATLDHPTDENYVIDQYEPTVKMSTYLLAFIVCEFASTYAEGHEDFKIWAATDRIPDLAYAAEIGPRITEYYGQLFDYEFPLAKIDMAAIPDFQSGAMENWGLITYRDSNLFYNSLEFAESNRYTKKSSKNNLICNGLSVYC